MFRQPENTVRTNTKDSPCRSSKKPSAPTTAPNCFTATAPLPTAAAAKRWFCFTELGLDDFACVAWDARGHGMSPGARGDSPSIGTSVADVDAFIRHIGSAYGIAPQNICVVAQSVGAVLVSA